MLAGQFVENKFHRTNKRSEGEFGTEPTFSAQICITDIETDIHIKRKEPGCKKDLVIT